MKKPRRTRDTNQLAKIIVDLETAEESEPTQPDTGKDPAAVALGRKGGLKGGKARAKNLDAKRLSEIGKAGAKARWGNFSEQRAAKVSVKAKHRKVLSVDQEDT